MMKGICIMAKSKKKQFIDVVLNQNVSNDCLIYKLINKNKDFQSVIRKVDDVPVVSKASDMYRNNSVEQVIDLLEKLINRFDDKFPTMHQIRGIIIEELLRMDETKEYLLCKKYIGDNEHIDYFEKKLNYIFVYNFFESLKLMKYCLTKELDILKIDIDKISLDSESDLKMLCDLLSDLCWCGDSFNCANLFMNIYLYEKDIYKKYKPTGSKRERLSMVVDYFSMQFHVIISDYDKKKDYLKYFK